MAENSAPSSPVNEEEAMPRRSPELTMESIQEIFSRMFQERMAGATPNPYSTTEAAFRPINSPAPRRASSLFEPGAVNTPAPRRVSSLFEPGTSRPAASDPVRDTAPGVNVVYMDREIKEEDKMQVISLHAVMTFKKKVDSINASSPVPVKLQRYISDKVMQEIWNWECKRGTEFTWTGTYKQLFELDHNQFMTILARRLRPLTHEAYCKVLASCVPKIKAKPEFTLASPNYDLVLYQQIADYFQVVREVDEFARYGALPSELEVLPRHEYGKEDSKHGLGVFGIAMAMLGSKFADDYKRLIGVDTLKACRTIDDFLEKATSVNRELAIKSEKERIDRKELQPKLTFKALSDMVSNYKQAASDTARTKLQQHSNPMPLYAVHDEPIATHNTPEDDVNSEDDDGSSPVFPDPDSMDGASDQLYYVKTYKDKPPERVLPCYQHFNGKCTAGSSCVYSHDHDVLTAYGREQLQKLVRSKYVTAADITQALKEKPQNVVRPVPGQPTQDARRLPTGRGPGNLRILSRPTTAPQQEDVTEEQG
jgi:hypothetical protein